MPTLLEVLNSANQLIQSGQLDDADRLIDLVLAEYPNEGNALAMRGFIAHRRGNPEAAIVAYEEALRLADHNANCFYHLGKAYEAVNKHGAASAAYRRAAELAPSVAAYRSNYSQSLLQEWHHAVGLPTVGREAHKTYTEKLRNGFFKKYLNGPAILDIGYRGDFAQAVPIRPHAIGIDLDTPGYDGLRLPFEDASQDAVYSSHCLEHMPDPIAALREWHRVLKIGGHLVIAVPHQHLYERKMTLPSLWNHDHRHFFTPARLLVTVEGALPPNSYRVRYLEDNDFLFDYSRTPTDAPSGCYEIELVLEKIRQPAWSLV